ncbi:hypothetical protein AZZ77_003347, partial [Klebsiella pneumoniae]
PFYQRGNKVCLIIHFISTHFEISELA